MKSEQIEKITQVLEANGFGNISKDNLRKLIILVQQELVLDAVFTPLEQ